jgi:hypothetical protein
MTLNELFESLSDTRRGQGQRYALPDVLWMIFLGINFGYVGYKFAKSNKEYFTEIFSLKHRSCYLVFDGCRECSFHQNLFKRLCPPHNP